ncbi:succinyldiaminopimelate transaminase [Sulfuricella denitrificans skB26]|uniref:Succinyldiaminopimelate transaminase n=1 Tax=Sulfuricella denitrificans (strain DSM 22764 / NBRC 105220 / skB26) TaxID=1163617 RepID=S6ACD8_SULDS|nr:succinyldiaminopimelate transaminase [Sulfuricella denitrificans]BAN35498.1 succinyldiaminopimelate transaminase [Sulfuricella denitrificans skB26]
MNHNLDLLHPYPFQKLRDLFRGVTPNPDYSAINLSIGEPKHATPDFIRRALADNLDGLANYPTTQGSDALRQAIGAWIERRYGIPPLNPNTQILPVNGSREALFAFAQAVIDTSKPDPIIICPNPFYQIYEGAALLAGATPYFLNTTPENGYSMDFSSVPEEIWKRTQLVYACSPGNPSGKVMNIEEWSHLFDLSDKYGFIIAADECYSELYPLEHVPPLGALQVAHQLGGEDYGRLVVFNSLSKRSNVPGMRSGFVAGCESILEKFLLYRTYHGCAMNPAIQAASAAAWSDEAHVEENRRLYREKFATVTPLLQQALKVEEPDAAFYLWAQTPVSDTEFAKALYRDYNVTLLPGSFLAREAHGLNPGTNFVRIALVAPLAQCVEAAERIQNLVKTLSSGKTT